MALTIVDKVNKVPSPSLLYKDIPFGSLFRWAEWANSYGFFSVGYKTFDGGFIFLTDTSPNYHKVDSDSFNYNREVVLLEGELVITKEL